jgi:Holliday junction DNA helicase RuvA
MIASLKGKLTEKTTSYIILDVNGIGYQVFIPLSTYEKLPKVDVSVRLLTHLHVREDALILFGFVTTEERRMFQDLISVSGVGPKLALTILSATNVSNLLKAIASEDHAALVRIPGLGKKTAQRLLLDLKDKAIAASKELEGIAGQFDKIDKDVLSEATMALVSLGFTRQEANQAIRKTIQKYDKQFSVEELVQKALT